MTDGTLLDAIPGWIWALIPVAGFASYVWVSWEKAKRGKARKEWRE